MSAWEIIWRTYCLLDDLSSEIRAIYGESMCISEDTQRYAECILKFPNVHEEWLKEEWMYSD
jgi:hypothetical protein